jgi:hypothetical protein
MDLKTFFRFKPLFFRRMSGPLSLPQSFKVSTWPPGPPPASKHILNPPSASLRLLVQGFPVQNPSTGPPKMNNDTLPYGSRDLLNIGLPHILCRLYPGGIVYFLPLPILPYFDFLF